MNAKNQIHGDARQRIAENVKRLRKERGLSQEEMAELAEFHRTYVSQLERCITNISVGGLEKLAIALGVDVLDLLAKGEPKSVPEGTTASPPKSPN